MSSKNEAHPKEPKDLGIKIGSPREVIWTEVRDGTKADIESYEKSMAIHKEILALAERIIAEEDAKRTQS